MTQQPAGNPPQFQVRADGGAACAYCGAALRAHPMVECPRWAIEQLELERDQ